MSALGTAAAMSYGLGALCFLVLLVVLLTVWRQHSRGHGLRLAVAFSGLWCLLSAAYAHYSAPDYALLLLSELARDGAVLLFLLRLLGVTHAAGSQTGGNPELRWMAGLAGLSIVAMATWVLYVYLLAGPGFERESAAFVTHLGQVIVAVLGLALVEQLYRNCPEHLRWAFKLMALGFGGIFAYDLYIYSGALLLTRLDEDAWAARGAVNAMVVPLLAVSVARTSGRGVEVILSRQAAFHSAALLAAGVYLMLMAAAGYYIQLYGGDWGAVMQTVFLFGSLVLLGVLLVSGRLRGRVRVWLNKHFLRDKYEYRAEWLKFTEILSHSDDAEALKRNMISGIARLVQAPGGGLWERDGAGHFSPTASWEMHTPDAATLDADAPLVVFMRDRGWVIHVDELREMPAVYNHLELPAWLKRYPRAWLVVPLLHAQQLEGFILLLRQGVNNPLNWEDHDILKTVGRQAATHLAMVRVTDALADAQRFDAFNRLSSYVVHDLKNVAAQLTLVASNAKRHMHNPEFVADAMGTVENATTKMNRMLGQLRKGRLGETSVKLVNLLPIMNKVIRLRQVAEPKPVLRRGDGPMIVSADAERLTTVLEHLVQNAQEATPADGEVEVSLSLEEGWVRVDVRDSGCGMDEEFVARRLFRPFETTKGNAGMGIGVYESREFINMWGGQMQVASESGVGTTFTIRFPADGSEPQGRGGAG